MARNSKSSKGSTKQSDVEDNASAGEKDVSTPEDTAEAETSESVEQPEGTSAEEVTTEETPSDEAESKPEDEIEEKDTSSEPIPGVIDAHVERTPSTALAPAPVQVPAKGPGLFGMVFGGLIAGAIGFLVATFAVPEGWPNGQPETRSSADLEAAIADQAERLEALSSDVAALRDAPAVVTESGEVTDLGPLTEQITGVEAALNDAVANLDSQLAELDERMTALEERPATLSPDGSAAMEAQMEAFRQQLDDVTADAEARIAEAQQQASQIEAAAAEAAEAAKREAAIASLRAALDNGTAFSDTLGAFSDVPEPLQSVAGEGVPTLTDLQASYADAARAALANTQTVPEGASAGERFAAFLRRQTNARSLEPREGDDADAILSRAEAALADGNLETVLTELSALPDSARAAMSDWISAAENRAEALRSVEALETATN